MVPCGACLFAREQCRTIGVEGERFMARRIRQQRASRLLHDRGRRVQESRNAGDPAAERHPASRDAVSAAAAIVHDLLHDREMEQVRLDGVQLAAREMAHLLNNDLAAAMGLVELVQMRGALPADMQEMLEQAAFSLDVAARHIAQFQAVVRVATKETPSGVSLDLDRSLGDD